MGTFVICCKQEHLASVLALNFVIGHEMNQY